MNAALRTCLLLMFAALCGCSGGPRARSHIDLMSAERRWLEDQLYEAEDEVETQKSLVARLKKENKALREKLQGGFPPSTDADDATGQVAPLPANLSTADIELGTETPIDAAIPSKPGSQKASQRPIDRPLPVKAPVIAPTTSRQGVGPSKSAAGIKIHRDRTEVANWDQDPEADGLSLVLSFAHEDRSPGQPLDGISIDIWPAQGTDQKRRQRFANWVVSHSQLSQLVAASSTGRIRLELDWPKKALPNGEWRVEVAYTGEGMSQWADSHRFFVGPTAAGTEPATSVRMGKSDPRDTWTPRQ